MLPFKSITPLLPVQRMYKFIEELVSQRYAESAFEEPKSNAYGAAAQKRKVAIEGS